MKSETHKNPLIENIARVLWESEPHSLLAHAGKPTAWDDQPRIIKRGLWRKAIKVLAEFSKSAKADDVHPRIQQEIIASAKRT